MILKKEATLVVMLVVAALNALFHVLDLPQLDTDTAEAFANVVLTIGGALYVRSKVFSEHTVRQAGLTPSDVKAMADNTAIKPAVGP